jgi:hypothetical protein
VEDRGEEGDHWRRVEEDQQDPGQVGREERNHNGGVTEDQQDPGQVEREEGEH